MSALAPAYSTVAVNKQADKLDGAILASVQPQLTEDEKRALKTYFVFDAALCNARYKTIEKYAKRRALAMHNLHRGTQEGEDAATSSYLFELTAQAQTELLPQITKIKDAPLGIIMWSSWDAEKLAAHLQKLTRVVLEDDLYPVLLRWVDPLVLPATLSALWDKVGSNIVAPLHQVLISDLDGVWHVYKSEAPTIAQTDDNAEYPVKLTKDEEAKFHFASMTMRIYMELKADQIEDYPIGTRMAKCNEIETWSKRAANWGAKDDGDYFFFCSLADAIATDFDSRPEVTKALKAGKTNGAFIIDTLRNLKDEEWSAT